MCAKRHRRRWCCMPGKDLAAPRVDDGALELVAVGEHAVSEGCDYVLSAVALAEDVAA